MSDQFAVGVDIGGTKIAAGLVGRSGLVSEVAIQPTAAQTGGPAVLARAIAIARGLIANSRTPAAALGIATGGWIDRSTGVVVGATGLLPGWSGIDVRGDAQKSVALPTTVLNDVHAMGIAEARLGAGRGRRLCLSVAVGTGIGGAITIEGQLFGGAGGFAGAIGHVGSRFGGPRCSCGRRGCIEALASGPAIARAFADCLARRGGPSPSVRPGLDVSFEAMLGASANGDRGDRECAAKAIAAGGSRLGQVLGWVINVLEPDLIVIGGGAAAALGAPFFEAIRSGAAQTALPHLQVGLAAADLGPDAAVVGAGLSALDLLDAQAPTVLDRRF
jgi:glucokinase